MYNEVKNTDIAVAMARILNEVRHKKIISHNSESIRSLFLSSAKARKLLTGCACSFLPAFLPA